MASNTEASTSAQVAQPLQSYVDSYERVSKDTLFMILALLMEDFPVAENRKSRKVDNCRNVGALLVLPNDIVWAADCSRDGVHAVASLLTKHHDKANGCKMFMSRKPCRICAKLLVQSGVRRVLYLPLEPEYHDPKPQTANNADGPETPNNIQMKQVDILFTASPIAQTKFVLKVEKSVLERAMNETPKEDAIVKKSVQKKNETPKKQTIKDEALKLIKKYDFDESSNWLNHIKEKLPWPAFDQNMKKKVREHFAEVMEWIARICILSGGDKARGLEYEFKRVQHVPPTTEKNSTNSKQDKDNPQSNQDPVSSTTPTEVAKHFREIASFFAPGTSESEDSTNSKQDKDNPPSNQVPVSNTTHAELAKHFTEIARFFAQANDNPPSTQDSFDPESNTTHKKQAKHFIEMARLLAQRTDDPKTGVGAVIVSYPKMEIVSIGWNGFPLKAHYGEFARASHDDDASDNKFSYVIHAEQNALMMRNNKNIENAILFVTKSPCDECAPLIAKEGIKTVVVDADVKYRQKPEKKEYVLGYNVFFNMVTEHKSVICYQTERCATDNKNISVQEGTKTNSTAAFQNS